MRVLLTLMLRRSVRSHHVRQKIHPRQMRRLSSPILAHRFAVPDRIVQAVCGGKDEGGVWWTGGEEKEVRNMKDDKMYADLEFDLTEEQIRQMQPLYEKATKACREGKPGLIIAQIRTDRRFRVGFVPFDKAKKMIEITGQDVNERA